MTDKPNTYVGLDMSGAQTRCLVAAGDGLRLRHVSHGAMPPVRWDNSDLRDLQTTSDAVYEAISEAERDGGFTVVSAVVGVGGASVTSRLVHSVATLPAGQQTVAESDIGTAVRMSSNVVLGGNSTVLQLVPLDFAIDGRGGVSNPLGLPAARLEAFVRVIAVNREEHDQTRRSVNQASVSVEETVLGGFAAAYGTLREAECAQGVAHLDFGKSASSLTAYRRGAQCMASGIPVGRDHLVSDVARAFNTEHAVASSLISDFGGVDQAEEQSTAYVLVPSVDSVHGTDLGRPWPRKMLDKVIALRVEECMQLAQDELRHEGLMRGGAQSLVVTGDIAALPGIKDLAQSVVALRTRVGVPAQPEGLPTALRSPSWACAAGLVLYAHRLAGYSKPERIADMHRQEVTQ